MLVYLNGAFLGAEEARVPVSDQGVLLGLGAFETLRAYGGRVFRLEAHLDRLAATLRWLELAPLEGPGTLARVVDELLQRTGLGDARLRITVTAGSPEGAPGAGRPGATCLVTAVPLRAPSAEAYGAGIGVVRQALPHGLGPGAGHKVTSYLGYVLARRAAERAGAGEALLEAPDGQLIEGAYANLFLVRKGQVWTPPLDTGALPGVTRAVVLGLLASCGLRGGEGPLRWADLAEADEAFVTSSIIEVLPVTLAGGLPVGDGVPGPVTRRVHEAYRGMVALETGAAARAPESG